MRQSDLTGVRAGILARHFLSKKPDGKGDWTYRDIEAIRSKDFASFWDVHKARKRHFVLEFNNRIYTATSMVMEQSIQTTRFSDGSSQSTVVERAYDNTECPLSMCSGYIPYDMLGLHGVYGGPAQQRIANLTNYGESHGALRSFEVALDGNETTTFTEGDICMMYGPPNAGKNVTADYLAQQFTLQGLRCCLIDGFETREFAPKSIPGWLSMLDKAAEEHDVLFCDGTTDLLIKGQTAKTTGGADNEHAIEGPKWFSGLAASKKILFWMANTMDQADSKILEARRTMYSGKFSSVIFSPGREKKYVNTVERGSGFGARVPKNLTIPASFINDPKRGMKRFSVDVSMNQRVDDMRNAMRARSAPRAPSFFERDTQEEERF